MVTLSGEQRKELLNAINLAYPDIGNLEILVSTKLEQNLNNIAGGNNNEQIIFKLIQWVESKGCLKKLIDALAQENDSNDNIKAIKQKLFPQLTDYIGTSHSQVISVKQWNELYVILEQIDNGLITGVSRETLRDIQDDILGNYLELAKNIDLSKIKTIFLENCPRRKDNVPTIIEFAERLTQKVSNSLKSKLKDWVRQTASELNIQLPTYSEPQSNKIRQSYLLITLIPRGNNQFYLEAELIPNYQSSDRLRQPVKLDVSQDRGNIECSFAEIADKIYQLIQICEQEYLQPPYTLTIELFLPFQYLGKSIDLENIPIMDGVSNEVELYHKPIGNEYKFIVRCYERCKNKKYLNLLVSRWQELEDFFKKETAIQVFNGKIVNLTQSKNCEWDELVVNWEEEKKLGIKIVGCWSEADEDQERLFFSIIRGGIPIAIWTRCTHLPNTNLDEELHKILTVESLKNLDKLFESV